jgi:hypothetical protein
MIVLLSLASGSRLDFPLDPPSPVVEGTGDVVVVACVPCSQTFDVSGMGVNPGRQWQVNPDGVPGADSQNVVSSSQSLAPPTSHRENVGATVGVAVGAAVGAYVGAAVGGMVGCAVGVSVGVAVGAYVGAVGASVGAADGAAVGVAVVGALVGVLVGACVGAAVGFMVGAHDPVAQLHSVAPGTYMV